MKVEERFFLVSEIAERLGVSTWTVTEWLKVGRVKGIKIGKSWRVRESDFEAFLANPPPLRGRYQPAAQSKQTPPPAALPTHERSPQERRAALVARLRELHAGGHSLQVMANQLNTEGIPTISGKGKWQKGTIANLLAEEA